MYFAGHPLGAVAVVAQAVIAPFGGVGVAIIAVDIMVKAGSGNAEVVGAGDAVVAGARDVAAGGIVIGAIIEIIGAEGCAIGNSGVNVVTADTGVAGAGVAIIGIDGQHKMKGGGVVIADTHVVGAGVIVILHDEDMDADGGICIGELQPFGAAVTVIAGGGAGDGVGEIFGAALEEERADQDDDGLFHGLNFLWFMENW